MLQSPEKQKDNVKNRDKRHRTKYPARIFGVIVGLIILITAIGHFWFVPAKVHQRVERELLRFWDGQVRLENIRANYLGPIHLGKVIFIDKKGREYLNAGQVKMTLTKWPGLHPVVTEIEVGVLSLQIPSADKKFILPVTFPSKRKHGSKKTGDIRKFTVNDAEITVTDTGGTKTLYNNLQLLVIQKGGFYDFLLIRAGSEPSESLLAKGRIDSNTLETELSLQVKHTVRNSETTLIFAALNTSELSAGGSLTADVTMVWKRPAGLKMEGTIDLEGWTVAKDDEIIADNLTTRADLKDRRFGFENITATVFNGSAAGSLHVEIRQSNPAVFSGHILAQGMDFAELTSVLGGPGRRATRGSVTFSYNFSGEGKDLQNLVGRGHIFLDDADITVIPVVSHIFNNIGLSQFNPLEMSDAGCAFTTAGPVVTLESAHVANRFAAIRVEPGGTINLQTKQIDLYVIASPLKQIDVIINRVPIVNIFGNLKDKLIRLHVRGNWSDSPAKLIKKEPIKDVRKATVGFFQDVIKSGDQIIQKMLQSLDVFTEPGNDEQLITD